MNYRFLLEPYKGISSRHTCPSCEHKRCFTKYIDTEKNIEFPDYVGRCNREHKCGYNYPPKEYFAQNPIDVSCYKTSNISNMIKKPKPTSFINPEILEASLRNYEQNNLYLFLCTKIGCSSSLELMHKYKIGTSTYWQGATIFWQVDINNKIRTGKVMLYESKTGRRTKRPFSHITWMHSIMDYKNYNLQQCFFGEHLLSEDKDQVIAIVESEKSALIASHYMNDFIWLATGGKNGCFKEKNFKILAGRRVVLFPDLGAIQSWKEKADKMRCYGISVNVFDYLEKKADTSQREEGYDIADFLLM